MWQEQESTVTQQLTQFLVAPHGNDIAAALLNHVPQEVYPKESPYTFVPPSIYASIDLPSIDLLSVYPFIHAINED